MPMTRYQRPWHFLYFAPDPHQHGSLRPIRSPLGVNPGRGPLAPEPAPLPITGSSPSDSRIGRVEGPEGPPRRIAEPPAPVEVAAPAPTRSAVAGAAPAAAGARPPGAAGAGGAGAPPAGGGRPRAVGPLPPGRRSRPRGEGGRHSRVAARRDRRLAGHGHPEDRRGDAVADEPAELVVQ